MMDPDASGQPLSTVFLAALAEPHRTQMAGLENLEQRLRVAIEKPRLAWPDIPLSDEKFLTYLAPRLPEHVPAEERLEATHLADIWIACAFLAGSPAAREVVTRRYLPEIDVALARLRLLPDQREELRQSIAGQILAEGPAGAPLIAKYSGHGQLAGWLRVTAVNLALKELRRDKNRPSSLDCMLEALPGTGASPEMEMIKEAYGPRFRAALEESFEELTSRQRLLLRQHYVHGLTLEQMGGLYRVNRSTVCRWLDRARQSLLERTRRQLIEQLGLHPGEALSLIRAVLSQAELTLSRLLPAEVEEREN